MTPFNPVKCDGTLVTQRLSACNLGVFLDKIMSFFDHINKACKDSHLQIRDVRSIQDLVHKSALIPLPNALILFDYCNSLNNDTPDLKLEASKD